MLTYRDIRDRLNDLTDEQLDMNVTVVIPDSDNTGEFSLLNIGGTCFPDMLSMCYGADEDIVMDCLEPDLPLLVVVK